MTPRELAAIGMQAAPWCAWAFLVGATLSSAPASVVALALCVTTAASALSCWARVVARPRGAAPWALLATGWTAYALGFLVVLFAPGLQAYGPGDLNLSDTVSLLLYPTGCAGLLLLGRAQSTSHDPTRSLDAAVTGLSAAAVTITWAALAFPHLLEGDLVEIVYALAYPAGGATLLVMALTGLAWSRWRWDARWVLLLAGLACLALGDAVYGTRAAAGTFSFGTPLDALYTAGPLLASLAGWRQEPVREAVRPDSRAGMAVSVVAALVAPCLLLVEGRAELPYSVGVLAVGSGLLGALRTVLFLNHELDVQRKLRDAARDEMTGLWNRRAMLDAVRDRLLVGRRTGLLLLDLDGLAAVNDALGHTAGDRALRQAADLVAKVAGPRMVARLVGDEFAVVLDDGPHEADDLVEVLLSELDKPLELDGMLVVLGARAGVARTDPLDGEGDDAQELLRQARVALDAARKARTPSSTYAPDLDAGSRDRLALLGELRVGLAQRQFVVHQQPKSDPVTRRPVALETLVRWQHPTRGLLGPGAFLPEVEAAGLLPALTRQVLDLALQQASTLALRGHRLPVAVNVGAPDLLDPGFAANVLSVLDAHGLGPDALRIEVTETVVMSDPDVVLATLDRLRSAGVGVSLDDYGTGLSSLEYLRKLPIDELKIDRSFVSQMVHDGASALIVRSTVDLAHALGLRVVAEGVEDEQTLQALASAGCDLVQGYLLGRPVPAGDLVLPTPAGLLAAQR